MRDTTDGAERGVRRGTEAPDCRWCGDTGYTLSEYRWVGAYDIEQVMRQWEPCASCEAWKHRERPYDPF